MVILFLSYWGVNDPLTVSTIFPHLGILQKETFVKKIVFVSIERNSKFHFDLNRDSKIEFVPILSKNLKVNLLNKINDFLIFPKAIIRLIQNYKVDLLIARGAPAGALAYKAWLKTNIPFVVESFEPHADYMLESGVWKKNDLRYIFEKRWEEKQKKYSYALLPVAENYRTELISEGVNAKKIKTVPCCINNEKYAFNTIIRERLRQELGIGSKEIVGIYVGKFGGLYYEKEAFDLFKKCFDYFNNNFKLLILSPNEPDYIENQLLNAKIELNNTYFKKVKPELVPQYLSVSDFGIATYKPGPSKLFLSPIKVGEYWANGLPVLITDGIGDETYLVDKENCGATFVAGEENSIRNALVKIEKIISNPESRKRISILSRKYRSLNIVREVYRQILRHN
ncbi:glycosyltransferase [Adhaeribacter terreus]|uniref:Glycosyltransferase n=1 Tax=Adhaeribacter terreus TaxID=529703 RepID=A0ABW0E524_9BACT